MSSGSDAEGDLAEHPILQFLEGSTAFGRSHEWCTLQDLFYLYYLITGRTCQLARCLAEYFATYYYRQQRGAIYGGAYITIIGQALGHLHQDTIEELSDPVDPVRLDRRTLFGMKIVQDFPGVGLRFSLVRGVMWVPPPTGGGRRRGRGSWIGR
ncbi:hypothetical protein E3N88_15555 [Mikania micrantha]|uniref:Uncharacterized protein n=1 Tax=Mikania micrantha TaxID=192012 RepID=A0A5N6NYY4_9ASTR|nr:hypothetical protein E3N88_15555 [Mikania micrantha]